MVTEKIITHLFDKALDDEVRYGFYASLWRLFGNAAFLDREINEADKNTINELMNIGVIL